ncbi:MAG TPA: M4 family metallopeptidase [Holophagaceae bacterium]|nr:M4 family metallopeptidase [Holophagaceae bacterium]
MRRPLPGLVSALVLTLATGPGSLAAGSPIPLDKPAFAFHKAQQPFRVAQATQRLTTLRGQMGLTERDGFVARQAFTNAQGQAVVRLEQTYAGQRVWGGQAVARVSPDGTVRTLGQRVHAGIALEGQPRLTAEQAEHIAVANLAPKGGRPQVQVERVVFPAEFVGGLATKLDATGRPVVDRARVVHAKLDQPYVWAFEVRTRLRNPQDGAQELAYVIHGDTGAILRVQDLMHRVNAGLTPAVGTGQGRYRGAINLPTTQMADGTFTLMDTTRGLLPNPSLAGFSADPTSGWDPTVPALQTWYGLNDAQGNTTWQTFLFQKDTNAWGDGLAFTDWGNEGGTNGQTDGVDAHSAMATTWDFYHNVFGRDGLDGAGTAVAAYVHLTSPYEVDNASWSIWGGSIQLGAGSYGLGNPGGLDSLTDLDVIAHEMTHGVTSPTFGQAWQNSSGAEEAGLNEAVSDFFAQMVVAYAGRPAGADDAIPAAGAEWQIGRNVGRGTPLRTLDKPSLDGRSPDGWFDGIKYMDGHYSAGPLNRAFYYLCNGAPASTTAPAHSVYLPGGMPGLGNDVAARIVYKAVTEYLIGDATGRITFMEVRNALATAAEDLHGAGAAEIDAVKNAFAAANIGDAPGQAPRTMVAFLPWRDGDYIEYTHTYPGEPSRYSNRQVFPKSETVAPRVDVLHNANTAVHWSLGGPSMYNGAEDSVGKGGTLNPDGTWTTPNVMGWHAITATSTADPNQLAEGRVFLIDMDTDQDLEQDALDMAGIAYSWWLSNALNPSHSVFEAPWVDDADAAFFVDALRATWPVK